MRLDKPQLSSDCVLSTGDIYAPIQSELERVTSLFDDEVASQLSCVNDLCRHIAQFRGKMLRPALLLLTAKACGTIRREHITLSAVVEMVHMAALVHDDVLDEAEVRRGVQSVNYAQGNEAAVMLGDYLIGHAYYLCSGLDSQYASRLIGATANTVCEGELMQIHLRGSFDVSEQQYFDIISRKTASLTSTACVLGAKFADAEPGIIAQLEAFGMNVGIAFQIVDDILDLTGSEHEMGKTLGLDAAKGKLTLPLIRYFATADAAKRAQAIAILHNGHLQRRQQLRELLGETDALAYATDTAARYARSALANLSDLPASDAKESLQAVPEFILRRRQ